MEIKDYLREHPFIRPSMVEKELGIPHGTIRLNNDRKIPEKYQQLIIGSLQNYSPITHVVVEEKKVPETAFKPVPAATGKQYVVRKVYKLGIEDKHAYYLGVVEGGIFRKDNDIQDNVRVTIG